jgi:ACS family hexuronate transporter-like MFS transporter
MLRWRVAILVSAAIAISYLDRQTLPVAIGAIREDIPISNQVKAFLDSAFLVTYGLMYLGGGRLMDVLGTRTGFTLIMILWSLACASHGIATNVIMLATSRLLLGIGEGGGFPAATRAVTEWFPVKERSTAMGMINAGTAVGAVIAPPGIALVILKVHWLGLSSWRWVFFITGAAGLLWTVWWVKKYFPPEQHRELADDERAKIQSVTEQNGASRATIPLLELLRSRETWGIVVVKFLSDAAWYFYIFWLPKYLLDEIPLGIAAAAMPWVMLVPHVSVPWCIVLFSLAFFGHQWWSTLIMILPTDLFPKRVVGAVAGLVGLGGAMGGVVLGQLAGYLLDHGFSYAPVLAIAGSLHMIAFLLILTLVRLHEPLSFPALLDRGFKGEL